MSGSVAVEALEACFTCEVAHRPSRPDLLAYRDELVLVNHLHPTDGEPERTGWFVVAPVRHVTRWFELTGPERQALTSMSARVDEALTVLLGARRSMVASLGWYSLDHVHVHVVPTVSYPVTFGWENFGPGRFVPLGSDAPSVTADVRAFLSSGA